MFVPGKSKGEKTLEMCKLIFATARVRQPLLGCKLGLNLGEALLLGCKPGLKVGEALSPEDWLSFSQFIFNSFRSELNCSVIQFDSTKYSN